MRTKREDGIVTQVAIRFTVQELNTPNDKPNPFIRLNKQKLDLLCDDSGMQNEFCTVDTNSGTQMAWAQYGLMNEGPTTTQKNCGKYLSI